MIEIEKRVLMSQTNLEKMKNILNKEAVLKSHFKRFTMVEVVNASFAPDTDNLIERRIRSTGNESKLTVKYGNWHTDFARKEYEVAFKTEEFRNMVNILILQGNLYFITTYIERFSYVFHDFILTLDSYFFMQAHLMEVEISIEDGSITKPTEDKIDSFLNEMNLIPLDSKGTIDFINELNSLNELRVDFTKTTVDEWYKKWKDYIFCKK